MATRAIGQQEYPDGLQEVSLAELGGGYFEGAFDTAAHPLGGDLAEQHDQVLGAGDQLLEIGPALRGLGAVTGHFQIQRRGPALEICRQLEAIVLVGVMGINDDGAPRLYIGMGGTEPGELLQDVVDQPYRAAALELIAGAGAGVGLEGVQPVAMVRII